MIVAVRMSGLERRSQVLGIAARDETHPDHRSGFGAQHPTKRMCCLGQHRGSPAALADRPLPVPDQHPRHRPSSTMSCHQPANRSSPHRDGNSRADSQGAYPLTITRTGSLLDVRACPNPTGTSTSGNHGSHWATSPVASANSLGALLTLVGGPGVAWTTDRSAPGSRPPAP